MKKILSILILLSSNIYGLTLDQFVDALQKVESNNSPTAIGDNGKAKGILQIHPIMVKDFNRISKKSYTHDDCFDPVKSREICKTVLSHYAKIYEKKTGKKPTARELSYLWNGSFNRMMNPNKNVKQYWSKVYAAICLSNN